MLYRFVIAGLLSLILSVVGPMAAPQLLVTSASAQVSGIVIEGNQRVENDTILAYLQFENPAGYSAETGDASVKALFQTGLFTDVQIFRRDGQVVVKVEENPQINRVNFEGNSEIKDKDLEKEVELRERMMFTRAKVVSDVNRIITLYRRSGFYTVTVSPKIIRLPQNRVDLVFEINEGGETKVRNIDFVGNNNFSARDLRSVVGTQEARWWKFFAHNDTYDPDRVEYDKELLRRYYLRNGFADVRVVSADAVLSDDGKYFNLTFTIEEGPKYKISDVAINVGDADLDPAALKDNVRTGVGEVYDAGRVDATVQRLTLEAAKQGYVFAKVNPSVQRNEAEGTLSVTYDIVEGSRTYIERIDIVGNTRTEDEVIRRELRLYEGDAFNRVLVDRARRRLTALDYFDKVDFVEEEGSAPDRVVLVVQVIEKSTGSINFSLGFSTVDYVVGSVSLSERNFLGKGYEVKINTTASWYNQSIDASFTNPYMFGLPISGGIDVFANRSDYQDYSSYDSNAIGFGLRAGFRLDEYSTLRFNYTLARTNVNGINPYQAAPAVIESGGKSTKSAVGSSYTWDNLDNPQQPTSGFRGQLVGDLAGLGGDVYYAAIEAHGWYFVPIYEEQVVLKIEGNAGHIQGFNGKNVPLQDRFYKGGDSFRGFRSSGVGVFQRANNNEKDSIGANTYAIGTLEMVFPVGLPPEWGVAGEVFSDFGTVFGAENESQAWNTGQCIYQPNASGWTGPPVVDYPKYNCTVDDSKQFRLSVGAGLIWQSPFGPLRFEAAYPLIKAGFDASEIFRFSVGTRF
ncbi:MAG: outer membrane protein assembly factor BamA [Hyphomicrobiales bacterium]